MLAAQLKQDPWKKLLPFRSYLGQLKGKKVANLLGSNGKAAVSLALLGADVTVVDISSENARYARHLSEAAGVTIRYVVSDVMAIPNEEAPKECDIVLMELGIIHWIMDIRRFFQLVSDMLRPGSRLIWRDFHPVKRGLLRWENGQMTASGNYFDTEAQYGDVPYAFVLTEAEQDTLLPTLTRGWTMGDIITSIADAGLCIRLLDEESGPGSRWMFPSDTPAGIESRIPALYTLVADRNPS